jgi:hypothetical protein
MSAPAEPTPDKKKRPPRKKKKNKQPVPPLESTDEGNEPTPIIDKGNRPDGEQKGAESSAQDDIHQQPLDAEAITIVLNTNRSMQLDGTQKKLPPEPSMDGIGSYAPAKTLNTNASMNEPTKLAPQADAKTIPTLVPNCLRCQQMSKCICQATAALLSTPVQPKAFAPKPGTWASISAKNDKSNQLHQQRSQPLEPKRAEAPHIIAPSPDWRTHTITPLTKKKNLIPPPPLSQPGHGAWPTLGDVPPPPVSKPKDPKQSKSLGAWGKAS